MRFPFIQVSDAIWKNACKYTQKSQSSGRFGPIFLIFCLIKLKKQSKNALAGK